MAEIKKFRSVSVSEEDYLVYEKMARDISYELGAKLSIAQIINMGMKFYKQRREVKK